MVRSPSGVIRIIERAVGAPPTQRRGAEMDADRLHVVAVDAGRTASSATLPMKAARAAERGDAGGGVAGGAAGGLDRRPHQVVEPVGFGGIDQPHGALGQPFADEEIVLGARHDVDDRVADAEHVVLLFGHARLGSAEGCGEASE